MAAIKKMLARDHCVHFQILQLIRKLDFIRVLILIIHRNAEIVKQEFFLLLRDDVVDQEFLTCPARPPANKVASVGEVSAIFVHFIEVHFV